MKILLFLATVFLLSAPAFAEPHVRQAGFTAIEDRQTHGNRVWSKEEQEQRREDARETSWFSSNNSAISRNSNRNPTLSNNLNRKYGTKNVNAAKTLWSNLNN